jgi:autotransporter-associated beta strand protein
LTISGAISGTGFSLTENGTGTVELSGVNTYTGGTTVAGGTLVIGGPAALPAGTSLTIGGGAVFSAGLGTDMSGALMGATGYASAALSTGEASGTQSAPLAVSPASGGSDLPANVAVAAAGDGQADCVLPGAAVLASDVATTSPEAPLPVLQASAIDVGIVASVSSAAPPVSVAFRSGSITGADVSLGPALFSSPPSQAGPLAGTPWLVSAGRQERAAAPAQGASARTGAEDKIRGQALQAALAGPSIVDAAWLQDLTDSQVDARHARRASRSLANTALDALLEITAGSLTRAS